MKRSTVLLFGCCILAFFGVRLSQGQTLNGSDHSPSLNGNNMVASKYLVPSCYEFNDQVNLGIDESYVKVNFSHPVAQSFTAGAKGRLVKIDIDFQANSCIFNSSFNFNAEILDGDGWNGTVLASEPVTIHLPYARDLLTIDFSSPATVYTGQSYTLRLTPPGGQVCFDSTKTTEVTGMWFTSSLNSYIGGKPYINGVPENSYDTYFVTTINPNSSIHQDVTACNSYFWSATGLVYFLSGTHQAVFTNSGGCDSVVVLNLTINTVNAGVTMPDAYSLHAIASGGSYQWMDCQNNFEPIGGADDQDFFPGINGEFAVEVSMNGCTDTSDCMVISAFGIPENSFGNSLQVYPNPTKGSVTVNLGTAVDQLNVEVLNALGQVISSEKLNTSGILSIEAGHAPGLYLISLRAADGRMARIRVLKE